MRAEVPIQDGLNREYGLLTWLHKAFTRVLVDNQRTYTFVIATWMSLMKVAGRGVVVAIKIARALPPIALT